MLLQALVSGFADTALRHLTGGASQRRTVRASDGAGSAADELWARLTSWTAERSPVGCAHSRAVAQRLRAEAERGGTEGATSAAGGAGGAGGEAPAQQDVPGPDEGVGATGLLRGHAYGLEAVREIAGRRLLRLRNPWGRGEWVGAWADGAEEWTDELLVSLGYQFGDDGTFWMELPDFCAEFNVVYLARLFERRGWDTRTLRGEWRGVSAAGCPGRAAGWRSNPAVSLTLAEDMELFCVLSLGGELPPAVLTSTAIPSPVFTSATGRSAPQEIALHPGRAALALVPSSTHANPTSRPAIGFAVAPASVLLRPSRGASLRGVDARLSGLPLRPEAQVSSGEEVRLRAGVYFLVPFTLEPGVQASWRLELCCSNGGALTVGRWVSVDAMAAAVGGGAAAADSEASFNGGCAPAVGMPSTVASPAEARAEEEEGEEDLWWGMETEMDSEEAFGRRASAGGDGSAFLGSREERRLARAAAALSEAYLTQQCDEMRPAWDMSVFRALATGGSPHAIASSDDILSRLALRRQQSHRVALRASTAGTPLLPRAVPSVSVRELPDEILKGAAEAVRRAKAELAQKRSPGGEGPRRRGAMPLPWDSAQPPHRTARTSAVRSADGSRRRHTSVAPHTPQAVWPGTYPLAGRGDGAGGRSAGSRRLPLPVPHWGAL